MSKRAEEATCRIHNRAILEAEKYSNSHGGIITEEVAYGRGFKAGFIEGYEQAEKDMKERFIQFIHRHYPINYIGWIQDFQKAMEDEK